MECLRQVTTPGIRQQKFCFERPSEELIRELLALDRKLFRPVTGLLSGNCALR
jgi:hypothetical protein